MLMQYKDGDCSFVLLQYKDGDCSFMLLQDKDGDCSFMSMLYTIIQTGHLFRQMLMSLHIFQCPGC